MFVDLEEGVMVRIRMRALLVFATAILVFGLITPSQVSAQSGLAIIPANGVTKHFVVEVTARGFNGTEGPLVLNLTQGDAVHITFLYEDHHLAYDNPHVIFLSGYDLRTGIISKSNPVVTLEFVATKTGTFVFYCVIPCQGMMNLEEGLVTVASSVTGTLPTALTAMVDGDAIQGQPAGLMATLTQASQPVPGVHVSFYVNTTPGLMKVGNAMTDQNGVARVSYTFVKSGTVSVVVEFPGSEVLAASSGLVEFSVDPRSEGEVMLSVIPGPSGSSISTPPYVRGQNRIPDIRFVGVPLTSSVPILTVILLIVGSVWGTYVYVFAQIRAIMRGSPKLKEEEKIGGERKLDNTTAQAKKGFDKRILLGIALVAIVAGAFIAFQYAGTPPAQPQTITVNISTKMAMLNGE